jgi:hypothetical protein
VNKYELSTIKDIFDKVPTDRIDVCLSEIGEGIKKAQNIRNAMKDIAFSLTGNSENSQAIWPDVSTWIDDGKGDVTVNTTIEITGGKNEQD